MSTIQFKEVNCKNCYKCIRNCPVKAITFKDDHAKIIEEDCILCGRCLKICPQNARTVKNDVDKVKDFINRNFKVYGSIAPSFVSAFDIKDDRYIGGLFKKLGFTYVEETAVGAEAVSLEYRRLLQEKAMSNIITTACPAIISLVEKYYGELVPQLAPVVSPMIAHAKMLKEIYGSRIKVVFIGPCLAKKEEYKDFQNDNLIDAVITFEELEKWIKDEGLYFDTWEESKGKDISNIYSRFYPAPGGIIKSLRISKKCSYNLMKFDGIERCIEILNEIRDGKLEGYFIEMNSCAYGCLGGPCMNSDCKGYLEMREKLVNYVNKTAVSLNSVKSNYIKADLSKKFFDKSIEDKTYSDEAIEEVLRKTGKFSKEDELNCGACGYSTCREKAAAVLNKKADIHMCLPYMRERAESISNVIINSTPNAIFAVAEDMQIQEANAAALAIFKLKKDGLQNKNITDILKCDDIVKVKDTREDIINRKYYYQDYNVYAEQSILYIKENHMIVIIIKDVTVEEKDKQEMYKMRSENVVIAQKVIEKQMRIAQEIASLLGETTAETKVALTKLKNSIQAEMGEKV